MNKNTLITIIVVLVLLVAISLYFVNHSGTVQDNGGYAATQGITPSPTDTQAPDVTASPSVTTNPSNSSGQGTVAVVPPTKATVKSFTVTGQNFSFSPSTITVNKGDTVKITLDNTGGFHDLRVDGYNVGTKKINGGSKDTVQFIADKTGTFAFYCSVGEHRQMGMKGNLIVK